MAFQVFGRVTSVLASALGASRSSRSDRPRSVAPRTARFHSVDSSGESIRPRRGLPHNLPSCDFRLPTRRDSVETSPSLSERLTCNGLPFLGARSLRSFTRRSYASSNASAHHKKRRAQRIRGPGSRESLVHLDAPLDCSGCLPSTPTLGSERAHRCDFPGSE